MAKWLNVYFDDRANAWVREVLVFGRCERVGTYSTHADAISVN